MATASVTYVFANGTNADGTQVNANFNSVTNFLNSEVIQRDGSIAFTAIPTLPASTPTLDNHAVRKAYVDSFLPAGVITQYGGGSAPSGWLVCDGSAVSRTNATYARLFAAIGTTYGVGDGSTTFNVPNLKGRVPVGYDATQTEFDALAETGGAKTHTLTSAEMPSHTHVQDAHTHTQNAHNHFVWINTSTDGSHNHDFTDAGTNAVARTTNTGAANTASTTQVSDSTDYAGSHSHSVIGYTADNTATNQNTTATNQNTGGGGAHNNLQPYLVVNYIIKL